MAVAASGMDSFGSLAQAIGLFKGDNPNAAWFTDPLGGSSANDTGLKTVLANDAQRNALLAFVDEALGPPADQQQGDQTWVPLFSESSPHVTVFAVVEPVDGAVRIGVAVQHQAGTGTPHVKTTVHVPLFHVPRQGQEDKRPTGHDLPQWSLIGRPGGRILVTVDAQFDDGPPTPGVAFLGGASVSMGIPTSDEDTAEFSLTLHDLQVPGAQSPQSRTLDIASLKHVGSDVLDFIVGLIRQQVDALNLHDDAYRHIAGLAGMLGFRGDVPVPPLPFADLATQGLPCLVTWLESILSTPAALNGWLDQLALLVGGNPVHPRSAVEFTIGPVHVLLGLRVTPGTGGHPVLVPWIEVTWSPTPGADVAATVELLRADTASGSILGLPSLRAEAVFGADAHNGTALLTGTPGVGSLRTGLRLDEHRHPEFVLTLHHVTLPGSPEHELLDLSSPDAALNAVDSVLDGALAAALDGFGAAGALLKQVLGLEPPVGITALSATGVLADPLGAIRGYWQQLLADSAAMAEVLGSVRALVLGGTAAPAPGTGAPDDPWRIDLATDIGLRLWREGAIVVVAVGADIVTTLVDDLAIATSLLLTLLRADLAAGHASFACAAVASVQAVPATDQPLTLDLEVASLTFHGIGARAAWSPGAGFVASVVGQGLTLSFADLRTRSDVVHPVPLPVIEADGSVTFAPDWDAVEAILATLLSRLDSQVIDVALDLLGWRGRGAHLRLGDLVADAAGALETWSAGVALDCGNIESALGAVAVVLSGGRVAAPRGLGTVEDPYRCSLGGETAAPGLVAWTVPGCPPPSMALGTDSGTLAGLVSGLAVPDGPTIARALTDSARSVPAVSDLTEARSRLGEGLDSLLARWAGTDSVTAAPSTLPAGVAALVVEGASYAEIVAAGRARVAVLDDLVAPLSAVVHVGTNGDWLAGHDPSAALDATTAAPAPMPPADNGEWFLQLPAPVDASVLRPDHDAVAAQVDRLVAVLGGRTADIVIVAYGAAGAAAIDAAARLDRVAAVVTIGTPWSPVSLLALGEGLGGDALRLLDRLTPESLPEHDDQDIALACSPLYRAWSLVRHSREVTSPSDLPQAGRSGVRAGLEVRAVFGSVIAEDVARGLASLLSAGVAERQRTALADALAHSGPPEELHLGVDIPVLETSVGGIVVGAGARIDLVSVHHDAPRLRSRREVVATLRLAVEDGWLVGGPGAAQHDLELRWLEARVHVPLAGGTGYTELVLHEARAFTASRERWVVRADADGVTATTALPEVKILLSEVAARIVSAAPDLAALLTALGILRADGLDVNAIDHLLFDPVTTIRPIITQQAESIATALRALIGLPHIGLPPTAFRAGFADAFVDVDLATGSVAGTYEVHDSGLPAVSISGSAAPAGVTLTAAVGTIDEHAGGLRLSGSFGTGGVTVGLDTRAVGSQATTTVGLYPSLDSAGLVSVTQSLLPAALIHGVVSAYRAQASDAAAQIVDDALDALGLLGSPGANGSRGMVLPIGVITDPGAWLRLRANPFGAVVAVLDALSEVVVPARPQGVTGWPITDGLAIDYAVVAGHLRLSAAVEVHTTLDGRSITTTIDGGLSIAPDGSVTALVDAQAAIDGTGLRLQVSPTITLDLIRALPATPLALYPAGAGLGQAIGTAAESAVRLILNELVDHRNDAGPSAVKSVGAAVHELGVALDLLENDHFTDPRIQAFASAGPSSVLLSRLPALVSSGVAALGSALDPTGTIVRVGAPVNGSRRIDFGSGPSFHVTLDGSRPAVEFGFSVTVRDRDHQPVGVIALEHLVLSSAGVEFDVRGGPFVVAAGPMTLRPVVAIRAAITSSGFSRLLSVGLGVDDAGLESAEFRWTFDNHPPFVAAITRDVSGVETGVVTKVEDVALRILGLAVSIASGFLAEGLRTVISDRAAGMLQGVVFTGGGRDLDPTLFEDLVNPTALTHRLEILAWNCATAPQPPSLTIDQTVTIALTAADLGGGDKALGVNVTLAAGKRFDFPTGDVKVALEVVSDWIAPPLAGGLSIFALAGKDVDHLTVEPGFAIAGIGVHFTKSSGPLLDLGSIALDGIALHIYAEVDRAGQGGGVHVKLDGLAFSPGGGAGGGVASNIMNDVGKSSSSNRPVFSPSFAVQKHPHGNVGVTLRAGDVPGPWWIVIQRQLGPLYVDRIGFNTKEANGNVTEISLLFNGQLSLFGLQAAVDELSITWHGGDVLSISSWSVDLMGLAISADMAGIVLAGGLLKTDDNGVVSYVGMLLGRFAAYGLSVFGGYTNDHGNASFFIFGAINGPIGGPPAFFLTGLGGGLGINRGLRIPQDLSQFGTFPFIQALDPGAKPPAKPMDELHRLAAFFPHEMGNFWFAAGISFTSFALVDGVAVVAVSFGHGLTIDLLGLARMALPRPGAALVSIELALLAHFSTEEGIFLIKAQLTDNSWLLYEDVRLTGGFAFAVWWKGPNAGQFVITMGGYHPSFHRDGYPDVPRLGIMWRISDAIVIKGESYFALTSEAIMAGVGIEASLDFGFVWASLAFGADAIVYFDPFWYEASAYARISAGISIDLGFFGTLSISATLGATIQIWGPDFAGRAEFEIGPVTVPVSFGSPRKVDPVQLIWSEFVTKYLEDSGQGARALSAITGRGSLPTSTGGQTGAPTSDGTEALPYQVFAEFEITFTTTIPTSTFDTGAPLDVPITVGEGQPALLGLSPMGAHDLTSTVSITLELKNDATGVFGPVADRLAKLERRVATDAYPIGVWGLPKDSNAKVKPLPTGDVVTAGKQLVLVAGVEMPSVGPDIDYHQVRADRRPLPLTATGNARRDFLKVAASLPSVVVSSSDDALTVAAGMLFADRTIDGVAVARGGHSALAQSSFRQDRSSPPMFGSLTDGLAAKNGDAGERPVLNPVVTPSPRDARLPFVAGYFTGGVGAVERPSETSVSDGRLKRRPAPTLDSTHARLALHLPVTLNRAASPAIASETTVVASGSVPRTEAAGSMRSFAGGSIGTPALQGLVAGLSAARGTRSRRATRASRDTTGVPSGVRAGDVVVLQFPDSAIDVDRVNRPSLGVSGKARVTATLGGTVLLDAEVADAAVDVPLGATHLTVHAGGTVSPTDGLAGWHDRARVACIGSLAALASGCTISVDAAAGGPVMQWETAGAFAASARQVTTRFPSPVTCIAVSLTGGGAASLTPMQLHLSGAQVASDVAGVAVPPVAVTLGDACVLIYEVVPDDGASAVTVIVTKGAEWAVSGVAGAAIPATDLARRIARQGMSGVVAKVLAVPSADCTVTFAPASKRTPRRAAAKRRTRKAPR